MTGAGAEIGRATAIELARHGARVAKLVCFRASDDASFITVAAVPIDGGAGVAGRSHPKPGKQRSDER